MSNTQSFHPSGARHPVGVGLKAQHYNDVLEGQPDLAFFEVHAENYMMDGGSHLRYLEAIAQSYPLSVHGVGMSLGSVEGLDAAHLARFKHIVDEFKPWLVSEHLAWSVQSGHYLNDLLPLPLNQTTLSVVSDNIERMQDTIGRRILVENPSTYVSFSATDIPEPEYLEMLAERTGCGILLDVNNIYVSAMNNGFSAAGYLDAIPAAFVGEIHLAGHTVKSVGGSELRIDDHGSAVTEDVWKLYEYALQHIGERPTLIEWDSDIPTLDILVAEAHRAKSHMVQSLTDHRLINGTA